MENRLNHIDSIAKDALQNLEFPYQPADWSAMESRIEKDAFLRTRLYWLKGGELLLMLLAFWVLFQFTGMTFPDAPVPQHIPPAKQNVQPPVKENNILPIEEKTPESIDNQEEAKPKEKVKEELHFAQIEKTPTLKTQIPNPKSQISNNINVPQIQTVHEAIVQTVHPEMPVKQSFPQAKRLSSQMPVYSLPQKMVLIEEDIKSNDIVGTEIDPVPDTRKHPIHLRIATSPDMNTTKSNYRMGMTLGGLTSVELSDKWQLESGLAYSAKFFGDLPVENTTFPDISAKDMNLHVVEIPLHLQYTIKKSTNWRPFVTAGFTANAVMFSNHEYSDNNEPPFPPQDAVGTTPHTTTVSTHSRLSWGHVLPFRFYRFHT